MIDLLADFNRTYPHHPLREEVLFHTLFDDPWLDKEATEILEKDGKFIAGIFVKHHTDDPTIAHIGLLHVMEHARGQGLGTQLMRRALSHLQARGVKTVILGQERHVLAPGLLDASALSFFKRFGFVKTGKAFNLHRAHHAGVLTIPKHPFTVRRLEASDLSALRDFIACHFSSRWAQEVDTYCATRQQGNAFIVFEAGTELVAFARANLHGRDPLMHNIQYAARYDLLGGIGPLGVAPAYRKMGLGRAIVAYAHNML
ncbi:MAG: GNAT family N-acetyltransferase, partial [Acholeplasmatales bacterium]